MAQHLSMSECVCWTVDVYLIRPCDLPVLADNCYSIYIYTMVIAEFHRLLVQLVESKLGRLYVLTVIDFGRG